MRKNLNQFIVFFRLILELNIFNSTIDKITVLCYSYGKEGDT